MNYLDNSIVTELKLIMEDDISFLYSAYLEDCEKQLIELSSSINSLDSDITRRIAHSIKGSSRNVGASFIADICERLEKDAREQCTDSWSHLLSEIEATYLNTKIQIEKDILSH